MIIFMKRQHPSALIGYTSQKFWLLLIPLIRGLAAIRFDISRWAEGAKWDEVYKDLCAIGLELKAMPNDKETYETFLTKRGYVKTPISNKKGSKRPTVNEMATRSEKEGAFICQVANHLVTVKDGYILDLWDSGEKSLYAYWRK